MPTCYSVEGRSVVAPPVGRLAQPRLTALLARLALQEAPQVVWAVKIALLEMEVEESVAVGVVREPPVDLTAAVLKIQEVEAPPTHLQQRNPALPPLALRDYLHSAARQRALQQ